MLQRKSTFLVSFFAIAAGMGGELHLAVPGLGFMAMLDMCSYALAIPILLIQWNRMGRNMHKILYWSFAWTAAAVLANAFHFIEMRYMVKCIALASSSWAIIAVSYLLLRDNPKGYLWYLVGAGLGGWIALYYFRNGALEGFAVGGLQMDVGSSTENLLEKQIYPSIARGILLGLVLPFLIWWRSMPVFVILCATVFAGFYLLFHGGSRSSFGIFCAAAAVGFATSYGTKVLRRLAKSPMIMLLITVVGGMALFGAYKMMASSGTLGDAERSKMESEFGSEGRGVLKGRAGFGWAIEEAMDSGGIGLGGHLRHHSVISNALACEGIMGFLFWVFFFAQCLWLLCHRIPYSREFSAFIFLMIVTAGWDVVGSPFGTRHKFFVLMAFIALCRDNPCYGLGTLFDQKMVGSRRWLSWQYGSGMGRYV